VTSPAPPDRPDGLFIDWDRSSHPSPVLAHALRPSNAAPIWCLWHTGFISNRHDLLRSTGLPESVSDAELLIHLQGQLGPRTAEQIAGTLAWVLWDGREGALLVVQDRIGAHPLYYEVRSDRIVLTDQIERTLTWSGGQRTPNAASVVRHLHGQPPSGGTYYEGVRAVEPGHLLAVKTAGLETTRYWRLDAQPLLECPSDEVYAEELRRRLFEVVGGHLPRKSPTGHAGITLSGGLDSTSIAAAIKAVKPDADLTAFTWVMPELPTADEGRYATAVAQQLALPSVAIRADQFWPLHTDDPIRTLPATPYFFYFNDAWDATYQVMQSKGVSAAFTGSGGDHLFGGNVFAYADLLLTGRWKELARQIGAHLPHSRLTLVQIILRMILSPIQLAYLPALRNPSRAPLPWLGSRFRDLYQEECGRAEAPRLMLPGRLQRFRLLRLRHLAQSVGDRIARAAKYGLEMRDPFIDHRLLEFALRLPTTQTFDAALRKVILRNAMRGYLPDEVLNMRNKITPEGLFHRGFVEREQGKVWELLTGMRAAELGYVDEARLHDAYRSYLAGQRQDTQIWHALTLEDWLRRYF